MQKKIVRRAGSTALFSIAACKPGSDAYLAENKRIFLQRIICSRGENFDPLVDYSLSKLIPPNSLLGLHGACELLIGALEQKQKIIIIGDFDADGATSTALLYRCMSDFSCNNIHYLVPNRFDFGYGLTPEIVELAAQSQPHLIVTVDNGISSIDGVEKARLLGIKVLITDHHLPGKVLPQADAIVNPNQTQCIFPSKYLAGVGVVFYLMVALRARLRENNWSGENWFKKNNIPEVNIAKYLDLVALGTIADVVPLDMNNRILVAQGTKRIRAGMCCCGILALLRIAKRSHEKVSASDFGFSVGPRLNAAGRLDDMSIGIRCLLTDDMNEALSLASDLDALNHERRAIESSMQADAARALIEFDDNVSSDDRSGICLYQSDWHQGVVGIVASRVKDDRHRPTIAFSDASGDELKGSGRSISGIHIRDVLDEIATANPGLLHKFGGHAMAAGMSIHKNKLSAFSQAFDACVAKYLSDEMKSPIIHSDGELSADEISIDYAELIRDAGPWGQDFPEPLFDGVFKVVDQKLVAEKHLKFILTTSEPSELLVDAIIFNIDVNLWPNMRCEFIHLAYRLDVNEFRGRKSAQLIGVYVEAVNG